jgi:hypothetical protein
MARSFPVTHTDKRGVSGAKAELRPWGALAGRMRRWRSVLIASAHSTLKFFPDNPCLSCPHSRLPAPFITVVMESEARVAATGIP